MTTPSDQPNPGDALNPPKRPTAVATATGPRGEGIAVRMDGIQKSFGSVHAVRGASLEVAHGEIHALVGENGAGKSTLMRLLSGLYPLDGGTLEVNGKDVTGWSTQDAIAAGVGMVHQHFMLVPTLTVAENVVLGQEPGGLTVDMNRAIADVRELSRRTGLKVDATAKIAELSVGEAQRVEILKALYRGAKVLILDEPTAVLSPPEVKELWTVLRGLVESGGTVVLITHKLDEVCEISDTITVMRGGRTVSRMTNDESTTPREIARAMVGRDVALALDVDRSTGRQPADADSRGAKDAADRSALRVSHLRVRNDRGLEAIRDLSFEVRAGEILGIAGVEGNGQTELLEAIAGLRAPTGGDIHIGSTKLNGLTVRQRADVGLSHIPEDRHRRGLVLEYSIAENLILGRQHHFSKGPSIDLAAVQRNAAEQIRAFDIRPPIATLSAGSLSGGNQQKIIIAREMGRAFTVLLAAQPTRGVDVGAIEFIHDQLRKARDAGKAILLVSADLPEVLALSDRVAVMYGGQFVHTVSASDATPESLGPYMTGADAGSREGYRGRAS